MTSDSAQSRWLARLLQQPLRPLRRGALWLWRQEGSPSHRALGLAAGVFAGCFPFFGLQTLLGVGLASLLRGNLLLAAAGTWISNPFTYVPLFWLNYQLGCLLLGPGQGWPGIHVLQSERLGDLGWDLASRLLCGSLVVASLAATGLGWLCWQWLRRSAGPRSRH